MSLIDITGQIFGRFEVLEFSHSNEKCKAVWLCRCSCGNEKEVPGWRLRNGSVKSCGCQLKEHLTKEKSKPFPICSYPGCDNKVKRRDLKFCSHKCATQSNVGVARPESHRRKFVQCEQCGAEFETGGKLRKASKFCSRECQAIGSRVTIEQSWLSKNGGACHAWKELRQQILDRDGHQCVFCDNTENLQCHHIIPRKFGGGHDPWNLGSTCRKCHGSVDKIIELGVANNSGFDIWGFTLSILREPDKFVKLKLSSLEKVAL